MLIIFLLALISSVINVNAQNVLSGPYLVEPGETDMIMRWEIKEKGDYGVEYGLDTTNLNFEKLRLRDNKHEAFLYEASLLNLTPKTKYFYRLQSVNSKKWHTFSTYAPNEDKFTFVAMGDSRSHPEIFTEIVKGFKKSNPDLIISMGDLVASGGVYEEWNKFYFSVAKDIISSVPLVSTLGDHEATSDEGELFRYFLRKNEPTEKQWFSYDYGNSHFISLDYRYPDSKEMIEWFENDIESSNKKWNFVYMHRACYNLGGHRTIWGRGVWPELFAKHNVDIVFGGHSHLYERFYPTKILSNKEENPVTYITTGGAGAGLYQIGQNDDFLAVAESVNHFVTIDLSGDSLVLKAIRSDETLMDSVLIVKSEGGFNKEYADRVVSREKLDMVNYMTRSLTCSFSEIPMWGFPARVLVNIELPIEEDVPFVLQLDKSSEGNYFMEPVAGIYKNEPVEVWVDIYSRVNINFTPWGELTPGMILNMTIEYNSKKETIRGGNIGYWPAYDDYK